MRLVLERDFVAPPGDMRNLIVGTERQALLKVAQPFWQPSARVGAKFLAEYDGLGNNVEQFMQRNSRKSAGIRFVDEGRFLHECGKSEVTSVRLPLLIQSVLTDDGRYYSALPLAVAKTVVKTRLGDVLATCGFQTTDSEFFKLPMDSIDNTDYTLADLFGSDFVDMYPLVKSLSRFGPGEQFLQMLQLDSERMQLYGLSSMRPVRDVAAPDEIDVILSLIAAPSLTAAYTYVNIVNAMQSVRYTQTLNPEADAQGVTLFFYYALQHSAFLTQIPADIFRALSAPDTAGVCTVTQIAGQVLSTPLKLQLPAELRQFGPMLGQVDDTMYASLMRARVAHKLLCVIRFLEAKGIAPSPSYRFSKADREKLFKIIS